MRRVIFNCVPYSKDKLTLALESGVDAVIVPDEHAGAAAKLSRIHVAAESAYPIVPLGSKADEEAITERLQHGSTLIVKSGWEVIPVENILAACSGVILEVRSADEARLACGILERGAEAVAVPVSAVSELRDIIAACKTSQGKEPLVPAVVTRIEDAGLGHRVCVDTMTIMREGQGMLCGNSAAFLFLVHAETSKNEYVASRPFRVNAGAVHAYARLPGDRTCYLGELEAGRRVLIAESDGETFLATVGRVKTEIRPMLLIEARIGGTTGTIFLQNAETVCLTSPEGKPLSVASLAPGDTVLCMAGEAGRHFGTRVRESITER
ncbi:MAG: 3-dehydroquinate synthase II family protein [Mailhella sp.]|nr:3-dehydroquinate synthase II family protein [Mailhella sp.]